MSKEQPRSGWQPDGSLVIDDRDRQREVARAQELRERLRREKAEREAEQAPSSEPALPKAA